ncbi:copper resistance CopC family protein [Streptomyces sp. NPDC093808]|uniref:copper resistance CopC family protein n=1 Tax=Streptomyces sp. NPDC093808 TaxID=3154985 RepID=UPI0034508FE4
MHVTDLRAVRTAAHVLVLPAALAALTVAAPPAAAHTELESGSPAEGASLAGLPPRVTLVFSDAMTQKYAKVAVTGPDGSSAAEGEPQVAGETVTLALRNGASAGRYTVGYRVVSADGHPVSGSYSFTVRAVKETGGPTPSPAPAPKGQVSASPAAEADRVDGESSGAAVPLLAGAGALVLAGAAGAYAMRRRRVRHGS